MLKKYLIYLVVITGLMACNPAVKYMQRGNYDVAVTYAVKKLQKNPKKEKAIIALEKSYPMANEKNMERINYLKLDGNPQVYDEIYQLYSQLKARQELVRTVVPLYLEDRTIQFEIQNYDQEIINAKMRAGNYYYNHAKELMDKNDRKSNREAYAELLKVKSLYPNYEDTEELLKEAKFRGISKALVGVVNETMYKLAPEFISNLISFGTAQLNQEWINYYTAEPVEKITIDFLVNVRVKTINISPEKLVENKRTETKKILDGYEYELDAKGNVKKDSLGNDIKKPKYKTISCNIMENLQEKKCQIDGVVEYVDAQTNQVLRTVPISAQNNFSYAYAVANGDLGALTPETKQTLGRKAVAFPTDAEMIDNANEKLRNTLRNVLRENSRYLDY